MANSVYWIRCQDHTDMMSQGYIGVSKDASARFTQHFKRTQNRHLKFAIEKYGWDNLIKSQILIADQEYCLEIERKLRPVDGIGWNCVAGGGKPPVNRWNLGTKGVVKAWNKGLKMSDETRAKVSAAAKEQWTRLGMRDLLSSFKKGKPGPMKGKKHSPESIEKMRLAHTGKVSKKKGKLLTDEQKANLSRLVRLKPWTCPHCQTVGYNMGAGNRWHFDNCKKKEY
jgi:group I intron endonuclease